VVGGKKSKIKARYPAKLALHAVTILCTIKIIKLDSMERKAGNKNFW